MTIINRRQEDILKELDQKGYVNVVDLCETHNVSTVTIRKDLNFLENEKLLHRTHGGASKQPIYAFERDVSDKESLQVGQKKEIAEEALKYISNNDHSFSPLSFCVLIGTIYSCGDQGFVTL